VKLKVQLPDEVSVQFAGNPDGAVLNVRAPVGFVWSMASPLLTVTVQVSEIPMVGDEVQAMEIGSVVCTTNV
jgi:predicted aconitase with swiveling domain